ncbi:MAG: N-acetylmuramoyl-L-alanine amidase, partial [Microthrixaceae bacterium]|nr:N-acetylmuramoyl-L-alanine amidase [Microthrixaceae bacterium]
LAALVALYGGPVEAQPLVVVDAGHGGRDPGAVGCNLQEKDIVLDVSRRLDGLLRDAGLRSALTRDNDSFVELRARAAFANDRGATLFVAIHANSNAGSPATGTETWIAEGASNTSNQLATRLQRELIAEWGLRDRGVKRANFTVLTATAMPAALTEIAFINRCDPDAALLGNANARAGIAAAHARAITAQLGVEAPPPPNNQTGVLRGVVFEDRGAGLDDPSVRLGGATVSASGQQARSAADTGAWQFTLPPGEHRVVARLDGFADGTRTCTVVAGQDVWCSVGLVRAMAPPPPPPDPVPDAAVPDPVRVDAAVEDAAVRPPQEEFDLGAPPDFGRPPEGEVDAYRPPARPRDAGRPPATGSDAGDPAEDEPTGTFCAAAPGGAGGSVALALLLLVGLLAIATLLLGRVPSLLAGLSGVCGARIAGATSGMLHVTSGLSGPPLAAYAVNDRWEQRSFVASVQVVFVAFALVTIGLRPMPVTPIGDIAILSAATVLGIAAGTWLTRFIPARIARRAMLTVAWLGAGVVLTRGLLALTVG